MFDGLALQGPSIFIDGLIWLVGFGLVGISEELMYRGYLQNTLVRGIGNWPAIVILSLLFAAAHIQNSGESVLGIVCVFMAGILFCVLRWQSGSLWLGIGMHAAWDWAQSYFYGTPDSGLLVEGHLLTSHAVGDVRMSGGSVGPEGSLLAQPTLLLGLLALILICRRIKSTERGERYGVSPGMN
jgi:membrane protease YdiL (CAAX protease family)